MNQRIINKVLIKLGSKFQVGDIAKGIDRYDFLGEVQVTSVSPDGKFIGFTGNGHDVPEIDSGEKPNFPSELFKKVLKN